MLEFLFIPLLVPLGSSSFYTTLEYIHKENYLTNGILLITETLQLFSLLQRISSTITNKQTKKHNEHVILP